MQYTSTTMKHLELRCRSMTRVTTCKHDKHVCQPKANAMILRKTLGTSSGVEHKTSATPRVWHRFVWWQHFYSTKECHPSHTFTRTEARMNPGDRRLRVRPKSSSNKSKHATGQRQSSAPVDTHTTVSTQVHRRWETCFGDSHGTLTTSGPTSPDHKKGRQSWYPKSKTWCV